MKLFRASIFSCLALLAGVSQATQLTLPAANAMSVGAYNNFNVYSLELLQKCAAAGDPRCLPSGPLPVQSGPGQIKDDAIVLASANGLSNFTSPFANGSAVNEVFLTPTGNQGSSYQMSDAGGVFTGDLANRWDISLDLLRDYLNGNDLVFLFDNNQSGSGENQWIRIWGQARIVDAGGNTINNLCFELSPGSGCGPAPTQPNDYVPVVGNFCVNKVTGASYNIGSAQNQGDCGNAGYYVSNNLGTSTAEFAAFNQSLNDAVQNLANGNYFLSLDVRYIGNNAGAEQLWICAECQVAGRPGTVPEPATLPLVLFGILAAGAAARRSRRD